MECQKPINTGKRYFQHREKERIQTLFADVGVHYMDLTELLGLN